MPKVSVIIPSYNCRTYIEEAIKSVLAQSYKDLEIIVIDDGSTDDTKEILKPYIQNHQIQYFYKTNGGLSAARNTGLRLAKGQFVKFLDSDDFLYPEQIEKQIKDIEAEPAAISITDSLISKANGKTEIRKVYLVKKELQFASFVESNRGVVHAFLTPKKLLEEAGGFDENLNACEDTDLWIRLLHKGAYVKRLEYVGCCYRILSVSMSSNRDNMFVQTCKIYEKLNRELIDEKISSQPLIDSLLLKNTILLKQCIARKMDLDEHLHFTMIMTNSLYRSQKKGIFKLLFNIFQLKNYVWMIHSLKCMTNKNYKFDLLHGNDQWRLS